MDVDYIDVSEDEPIDNDYENVESNSEPVHQSKPSKLDAETVANALKSKYKPIERKPRTTPIRSSKPIEDTVFACFEDYLAAVNGI